MLNSIIATILVSLVSLVGAVFLFRKKFLTTHYGGLLISMAAGVMLATAVLELLPEAVEKNTDKPVFWSLLGGICLFFIVERLIHWYHHHGHDHGQENEAAPSAYLILLGDGLHNLFDGVALATAFSVSVELGVATTVAVILHEIPQELADFVALVHGGLSIKKALLYNLLSAIPAIFGAVLGWSFLNSFTGALSYLLAFNAGMFIYISCSDLIPALHENYKKDRKWLQTFTFLLGVLLMAVLIQVMHEGGEMDRHVQLKSPVVESHLEAGE